VPPTWSSRSRSLVSGIWHPWPSSHKRNNPIYILYCAIILRLGTKPELKTGSPADFFASFFPSPLQTHTPLFNNAFRISLGCFLSIECVSFKFFAIFRQFYAWQSQQLANRFNGKSFQFLWQICIHTARCLSVLFSVLLCKRIGKS